MDNGNDLSELAPPSDSGGGLVAQAAKYRPSTISLLIANAVPLIGVLFFGWSTFAIVALYWAENIVIGAINVLKILLSNPDLDHLHSRFTPKTGEQREQLEALTKNWGTLRSGIHGIKLFLIPFFIVHYGIFCTVHGAFVFVLFSGDRPLQGGPPSVDGVFERFGQEQLWWGVAALAVSHMVSFFTNYLGRGEYRRHLPMVLMFQPYVRVVVLHVAILFGAFATMALGSPIVVVILLIIGKTILDLFFHVRERDRNE